jgi:hypothetical protein
MSSMASGGRVAGSRKGGPRRLVGVPDGQPRSLADVARRPQEVRVRVVGLCLERRGVGR